MYTKTVLETGGYNGIRVKGACYNGVTVCVHQSLFVTILTPADNTMVYSSD